MKIALLLYGIIGGDSGKGGEGTIDNILRIGYEKYKETMFDYYDIDVFIHTWSRNYQYEIIKLYQPKVIEAETQIIFDIPNYVKGEEQRRQNHYSRWYSTWSVTELFKPYLDSYDLAMLNRFDVFFEQPVDFSQFQDTALGVGRWCEVWLNDKDIYKGDRNSYFQLSLEEKKKLPLKHTHKDYNKEGLLDWWFVSSPKKLVEFGELYEHLDSYTQPNCCPNDKSGRISNHQLAWYHCKQLGLEVKDYMHSCDDFGLIRRRLLGCNL